MNGIKHPNFILGVISFIILFIGIGLLANGYAGGDYVLGLSFLMGGIHYIWSVIDVVKAYRTRTPAENNLIIWVILVIIIPPIGGLLFYAMGKNIRF